MKRVLSIVLAIIMSALVLTGCSGANVEENVQEDATEAVLAENVVAIIGDYELSDEEFAIYLDMAVRNVQQYMGNAPGWEETLTAENGMTARDYAISAALNEAWKLHAFLSESVDLGIYTANDNEEFIKKTIEEDFGGEEAYCELVTEAGLDAAAYKKYITCIGAYQALINSICSLEDAKAIYDSTYVTAKHILLTFEGRESEEKTLEEINAVYERVQNGENFEALIDSLGEDPGQDSATGYTFTEGVMVDEFYHGALDLEVGEVSEPVKTSYGYHIIKRYETPSEGEEYEYYLNYIQNNELNSYLTEEKVSEFQKEYPLTVNEDILLDIDLSKYTAEAATE